jgi:hypothetical protein
MDQLAGRTAGGRLPRYGGDVRISEDAWVTDEKTGELRLSEKGITRQKEDSLALAGKLRGLCKTAVIVSSRIDVRSEGYSADCVEVQGDYG